MSEILVTGLITYPVKSFAGVSLDTAGVTPRGLQYDRMFMVVDAENNFLSQRTVPEMALVVPTLGETSMRLDARGMEPVEVSLSEDGASKTAEPVIVHGKVLHGKAVEQGGISEWVNDCLPHKDGARGYRLMRVAEVYKRPINGEYAHRLGSNIVGFADGFPLHLTTEPSLAKLNEAMGTNVPMDRFRPNIVVNGEDLDPYDEDFWDEIKVGEMSAFVAKACDRCAIPDVDQATGEVSNEVRRALLTRKGVNAHDSRNRGVFFGQNLNHIFENGTVLRLGDSVEVTSRSSSPNVVLRVAS